MHPNGPKSLWWFTIISDEKTILLIEESWRMISPFREWVLIKSLKDRPHRSLSNNQTENKQGTDNISHTPRTPDKSTPMTKTTADVNPLPTTNASMKPHSISKPFNPESTSFTPFLGPPHMIPPPNIVQLNTGYFQHLAHPQGTFLQSNPMQIYQPEAITSGTASPQHSPFILPDEGLLNFDFLNLRIGFLNV